MMAGFLEGGIHIIQGGVSNVRKTDDYRTILRGLKDWDRYLVDESGLPGPRANLELAAAVAMEGGLERFRRYLGYGPGEAPYGSSLEFLPVCGAIGLGRMLSEGHLEIFDELRAHASDPRWRVREGVAIALQSFGDRDMGRLLMEMKVWIQGNPYEKRAAVAAICEPRLLKKPEYAQGALAILDQVTNSMLQEDSRKSDAFETLRKALGYCWSVAVSARPEEGRMLLEKWFACGDRDIRWVMRENLKKKRLMKMDPDWTLHWQAGLPAAGTQPA